MQRVPAGQVCCDGARPEVKSRQATASLQLAPAGVLQPGRRDVASNHCRGATMLQANEIQQQFTAITQAIGEASQACSADRDVPSELFNSIQKIGKQSDQAMAAFLSFDPERIKKMVFDMEQLADRAKQVCSNGGNVTPHMKVAVNQMHDALSSLKKQMV
jgi:hypothetical protein